MTEKRCTTNLKYKNQSPKAVKYLYDKLLDIDKCDSMTRITFLFSLSHANHMSVIPSYYLYSLSFDRENLGGGRQIEDAKSFEYPPRLNGVVSWREEKLLDIKNLLSSL